MFDYTQVGPYFLTICTDSRRLFFANPVVQQIADDCWQQIPGHFPDVELDAWVVMPNHIHGILWLPRCRGVQLNAPTASTKGSAASAMSPRRGTLGLIIRTYKAAVTTSARRDGFRDFGWQRNYYEGVIRDEHELERIREYVVNNPLRWQDDEYNPAAIGVTGGELS